MRCVYKTITSHAEVSVDCHRLRPLTLATRGREKGLEN
jgi:hypothetical protein